MSTLKAKQDTRQIITIRCSVAMFDDVYIDIILLVSQWILHTALH